MADDWESLRVGAAPNSWEALREQQPEEPPAVPQPLIDRMSQPDQPAPDFEKERQKWYSERVGAWAGRHMQQGDIVGAAVGGLAYRGAQLLEAPFKVGIAAHKAVTEGLTPEEELDAGQNAAIVQGIYGGSPPAALGGAPVARLGNVTVKPFVDNAAKEILKPVDRALTEAGLSAASDNSHADLANASAVAGGHSDMQRAGPTGQEPIGGLPWKQDFEQATQAVGGDERTTEKLQRLYNEYGVHPNEAALDAKVNPETRESLLSADKADLPREYDPWAQIPGIGFRGYEPEPEFPAKLDAAIAGAQQGGLEAARREPYFQNIPGRGKPKTAPEIAAFGEGEVPEHPGEAPSFGIPSGGFDVYAHPEGPAARQPIYSYSDRDRNIFRRMWDAIIEFKNNMITPDLVSEEARMADPKFARYKAATQNQRDVLLRQSEQEHQYWRTVSDTDRIGYLDDIEHGRLKDMPANMEQRALDHRARLAWAYEKEAEKGSKAGWLEDYFPHIWENPDKARAFIQSRIEQFGATYFQKERHFDYIREGLDAGLRLKSTNPEDLIVMRELASADMIERVNLLERLERQGQAVRVAEQDIKELTRNGWQVINGPDRAQWAIAPDVQPLWQNVINSVGLWGNEGMPGSAFRGWMAFKNLWAPIKLAASAFHFLHVFHINWNNSMARAWSQLTKGGDLTGAYASVKDAFLGGFKAMTWGEPGKNLNLGLTLREARTLPENLRPPELNAAIKLFERGGFVPEISEEMRINARRGIEDALDNGTYWSIVPNAVREGIRIIQKPLFEEWIPNLRAAAYTNEAQALFSRRPELIDTDAGDLALRSIAKQVDNRFGQMFYGSLFWNKTLADSLKGALLSLGWQLGFIREFVGAPLQSAARVLDSALGNKRSPGQQVIADATNKMPFVLSYMTSGMLFNGIMTMAFTGEMPEGYDYIFARIGGKNPDGSPRRVTNMFYLREIPMLIKHVEEAGGGLAGAAIGTMNMFWNKTMLEPFKEMIQNRDFYGSEIWDENGPVYMKALQGIQHFFGNEMSPISVTGAKRSLATGGNWGEASMSFVGFGPAPGYVAKDAFQNRMEYLYRRHVLPEARDFASGEKARNLIDIRNRINKARTDRDLASLNQAGRDYLNAGGSRQSMANAILGVPADIAQFRALPEADQKALMEMATPAQKEKYGPFQKTNVAKQVATMIYQSNELRQRGAHVAADAVQAQMQDVIRNAVKDGTITDGAALRRSITQEMIARGAPALSSILQIPKKLRPQYAPQLKEFH